MNLKTEVLSLQNHQFSLRRQLMNSYLKIALVAIVAIAVVVRVEPLKKIVIGS